MAILESLIPKIFQILLGVFVYLGLSQDISFLFAKRFCQKVCHLFEETAIIQHVAVMGVCEMACFVE